MVFLKKRRYIQLIKREMSSTSVTICNRHHFAHQDSAMKVRSYRCYELRSMVCEQSTIQRGATSRDKVPLPLGGLKLPHQVFEMDELERMWKEAIVDYFKALSTPGHTWRNQAQESNS
jgi:hypothetical protein